MENSAISWTDHTFSPWWGCTAVSPGCDHCYAESFDKRVGGHHWGKGQPRRTLSAHHWNEPLRWNRKASAAGVIAKVFCASMADVMDDEAPAGERERLWELIDATPNLLWQLLTKRPSRYVRCLPDAGFVHDNVILGCTAENQTYYDVRVPHHHEASIVLATRNRLAVHDTGIERKKVQTFVSYEPALGPIKIERPIGWPSGKLFPIPDWIIFGGETGHTRRPMDQEWAENIKAECEKWGVAFWMKQMSARTPATAAGLIPAHLLVRQFPEVL